MPPFGTRNLKLWYPDYQQRRALYAATLILEAGPTGRLYKERVGCPRPSGPAGRPLRFIVPEPMGVTMVEFREDAQRGDAEMKELAFIKNDFHGEWNYIIKPHQKAG